MSLTLSASAGPDAPPAPFPLVEVSGPPRHRGRMHGEIARDRVLRSVALYADRVQAMGLTAARLEEVCASFLPKLTAWAPDLVEEMEGIAEGAGLRLTDIILLNARTEVLQIAERETGVSDDEPDGCTGAVILPGATAAGRLIHGQNWDWKAECVDTGIVLKIQRDDGPDVLTFTEAGGLARSGLNSAGIAITANYLESDRDYADIGIPLPLIRRRVLEARHYAMALRVVAITAKSGSNNMIVSHAGGEAIDLECAPDEAFVIYPTDGMIVHANHWQSPVALSKLRETGLNSVPDSLYRDQRVRRALTACQGRVTPDDLKAALFDDFAAPFAVCRPPLRKGNGNLSATVAMVIMDPAQGLMELCPLPAINRSFTAYRLTPDAALAAAAE